MPTRWLHRDACNRAWRTLIQGLLVTMAAAAAATAVQVYQRAAFEAAHGRALDWTQVGTTASFAALTAAMALAAYLHRRVVDPSRLPSALPPAPPGATATTTRDHRPDTRHTNR